MANYTTTVYWTPESALPSNRSQVRVANGNVTSSADNEAMDRLMKLCDKTILSIVCVGLVGNTVAFSALSSRGCRGRRRRWRTHHALAILLQVGDFIRAGPNTHVA